MKSVIFKINQYALDMLFDAEVDGISEYLKRQLYDKAYEQEEEDFTELDICASDWVALKMWLYEHDDEMDVYPAILADMLYVEFKCI